jgi:hypothetical protein
VVSKRVLQREPPRRPRQQVGSVTASFGGDNRPSEAVISLVGSGPIEPILPCMSAVGVGAPTAGFGAEPHRDRRDNAAPARLSAEIWIPAGHLQRLARLWAICRDMDTSRPSAASCPTVGHLQRYGYPSAICSVLPDCGPSAETGIPGGHLQRLARLRALCRDRDTRRPSAATCPPACHLHAATLPPHTHPRLKAAWRSKATPTWYPADNPSRLLASTARSRARAPRETCPKAPRR